MRWIEAVMLVVAVAACSQPAGHAFAESTRPTPSVSASPSAAPSPTAAAAISVYFSGLPAGTYIAHLHSRCSGSASFHITALQDLVVDRYGTGSIAVPSGYFGRGLCVIVYANPSLSRVLATQTL